MLSTASFCSGICLFFFLQIKSKCYTYTLLDGFFFNGMFTVVDCFWTQAPSDDEGLKEDDPSSKEEKKGEEEKDKTEEVFQLITSWTLNALNGDPA